MSKALSGVRLRSHPISLAATLGSLLAVAGRDLPQWYVNGASGHAFRITVDLVFSQDSPVTLNFHDVLPLWENLGAWFKRVAAAPGSPEFESARAEALERAKESVNRGLPAIAFDLLGSEEYGLVVGHDGDRLSCVTPHNRAEPEWMAFADWPPAAHASFTRADVITLLDLAPDFDRRRADVAALHFAVEHFWALASTDLWLQNGQKAYEFWIATLGSTLPLHGENPGFGHTFNLIVLHAARLDAAAYLRDLAARYPEAPTLAAAAEVYDEVARHVAAGLDRVPPPGAGLPQDREARQALAGALREALAAERRGIDEIERALRQLR